MAKKTAKTDKEIKKDSKNKKSFFKGFKAELKKVSWPTPKQLLNNTVAVITIVLVTALIVFVLDFVFEAVNKHGVDAIKEVIGTSNTTNSETSNETDINSVDNTTTDGTEDTTSEKSGDVTTNVESNNEETVENTEVQNIAE